MCGNDERYGSPTVLKRPVVYCLSVCLHGCLSVCLSVSVCVCACVVCVCTCMYNYLFAGSVMLFGILSAFMMSSEVHLRLLYSSGQ